jgi:O-antigen/teichoic acid export membrane protein
MTRSARSTWNYLTVLAFSAISMAIALFVTPILLRNLGEARLGGARAVMDWAGYLALLEFGLGGALGPLLAKALAGDEPGGVSEMLLAGFRAYLRAAAMMAAGGLILAAIITRLVKIDSIYQHDLVIATLLAIVPLLLMPLTPLRALAEANQRGYVINLFLVVQSVCIAIGCVILAKRGWGITGQILATAIGMILFSALMVGDALLHYRHFLPRRLSRPPAEASRQLWQLNMPMFVMSLCGRVGLLTDNIIIGSMLSASAIVPFLMTQRLAQLAQGQLQAVGSATWAGLAQLHARGEHDLFRTRFLELTRLVVVLGLIVLLPIVAYNHAFVRLWLGEQQYAGMTLTAIASANALFIAVVSLWGWMFGGTGQTARLVPLWLASAALNLAVSLGLTWWFAHVRHDDHHAMWGPILGTSSGLALLTLPCMPVLLRRHFHVPPGRLIAALGVPLAIAAPYGAMLMWIASHCPPLSWLALAAHMSAAALTFALICWTTLLTQDDRARWKLRIRLATGRHAVA